MPTPSGGMPLIPEPRESGRVFATTHWTVVLASRGEAPEARQALSDLCSAYYGPVVTVLRSEGRHEDEARELAHAFFERLLERRGVEGADPTRGRFRSYLLGALRHFLGNRRVYDHRQRRGGDATHVALETAAPDTEMTVEATATPAPADAAFDRAWAYQVIERALAVLTSEAVATGTQRAFEMLKPWLTGDVDPGGRSQSEIAAELGWNDGALRTALHRLRRRFRTAVKTEIAATVGDPSEVDDELRYLIEALTTGVR